MNKIFKILIFGLIVWIIPTLITLLVSYLNGLYLFDVISAIAIAVTVIVFVYLYFKDITAQYIKEGIIIGIVWLVISIVLDIVLILLGITKLSLNEYAIYIAPLYIIIPAITIGFGLYKDQMANGDIE
ncbi:MAG: hypothetical protein LLF83_09585 [Methanobacterium sp.]|nr:hypothetical protein [Methanobacterium sp.]